MPISLFHNAWSLKLGCRLHFSKLGQRTNLNLSPLFDRAVVVQKSPDHFLCVGRDHSHQEADQVISIISLITHSGAHHITETPMCSFSSLEANSMSETSMKQIQRDT